MAHVLIVDKNPAGRALLAWQLGLEGHEVTEAANAQEALVVLATATPDAIVTEVALPDMSGHEFIAQIRADGTAANATVIVTTETHDLSWMVRSWELGATAHLTKPVEPEAIADVIAREVRPREVAFSS